MSDSDSSYTIYEVTSVSTSDADVTLETSLGCNGSRHAASTDRVRRANGEVIDAKTVQLIGLGRCDKSCNAGLREGLGAFTYPSRTAS